MDNKLSELSKPVFEIEVSGGHWLNCTSGKLTPDASADFSEWPDGVNRLYSQEYVSALLADNEAKDKRIAEVEGSHKKLRETLAAIHNTITGGGAYTSLAGILTAVKRAYLESSDASARTVTVEGDEQ